MLEKNMVKIRCYSPEFWIEEALILLKEVKVIIENIIFKYQNQVNKAASNAENVLALLPTASGKWETYQIWLFSRIVIRDTGVSILNFIPDWESEVLNQVSLQTNLQKSDDVAQKWEVFSKTVLPKGMFLKGVEML